MSNFILAQPRTKKQLDQVFVPNPHTIEAYRIMDIYTWRCACGAEQPSDESGFDSPLDAFDAGIVDHYHPAKLQDAVRAERAKLIAIVQPAIHLIREFSNASAMLSRQWLHDFINDNSKFPNKKNNIQLSRKYRRDAHSRRMIIRQYVRVISEAK